MAISDLNDSDDTFVVVQSDEDDRVWFASVTVEACKACKARTPAADGQTRSTWFHVWSWGERGEAYWQAVPIGSGPPARPASIR
ncbi:hypothetical protein [Streptomyces sp. NPDC002403]